MAGNAREYLYAVRESALGTVMTSPVAGTDSCYVRLTDGFFAMAADPVMEFIPYGGGYAVDAEAVSDHYECKGTIKTKLYPGQANFWMTWCLNRINSGQTTPWVTTELPGDLASLSLYHLVRRSDASYHCERF